jgi:uncharacterized protein (DUF952 family)
MIVHIVEKQLWEQALKAGDYRPASLASEGFIHASRPEQVLAVANRFYRVAPELLLVWIEPERLCAPLRYEASDGEIYPHIYGALNLESVVRVSPLIPDEDSIYRHLG